VLRELETLRQDRARMEAEHARAKEEIAALQSEMSALRSASSPGGKHVSYGDAIVVEPDEVVDEVVVFGNDVHVHGTILGSAQSIGGDVFVSETGRVEGDVLSFGGHIDVAQGGAVQGNRLAMELPDRTPSFRPELGAIAGVAPDASMFENLYRRLVLLLSLSGAGVLIVGLFPKRVGRIAVALEERPVAAGVIGSFATGFIGLFSLLFAVVTLGLGLPVSIVLMGALGLAWMLGFIGLCQAIGDRLPFQNKPHGRWMTFLVGVLLLTCLGSLPAVGYLVLAAASILGIGAAIATRFGAR
jgi:hypothetical protein